MSRDIWLFIVWIVSFICCAMVFVAAEKMQAEGLNNAWMVFLGIGLGTTSGIAMGYLFDVFD